MPAHITIESKYLLSRKPAAASKAKKAPATKKTSTMAPQKKKSVVVLMKSPASKITKPHKMADQKKQKAAAAMVAASPSKATAGKRVISKNQLRQKPMEDLVKMARNRHLKKMAGVKKMTKVLLIDQIREYMQKYAAAPAKA
ncbi:Hypothetical protein UVM_LOCUS292 [uncultured virus]|nr:Hypothetical protein UVM_LOCUS292 [uncultured virus]